MSIQEAALELRNLIQRFESSRSRVPQTQRDDYEKRVRKLRAELTRLESYDPDIDPESPEEMAEQVIRVARRIEVYLPEERSVENLTLTVPSHHAGQASMQATWDGGRWTLHPQRLAVHDVQTLAGHLGTQVCQTNDLDVWRASLLPGELNRVTWRDLGAAHVHLGDDT